MSKVITHNRKEKKKSGAVVVIATIIGLLVILIGLNYFLNKNSMKNLDVVQKVQDSSYTMGDPNAKINLVEYADFQCPACAGFSRVFPEVYSYINTKYGSTTLSITYKYFPLISIHRNALLSAYSAEAARLQDKFWDLEKVLFEKQGEWGEALDAKGKIEGYARDLGLDMAKFVEDRDSQATKDVLSLAQSEATKLRLDHTPTVFMNGVELTDLQISSNYLKKVIEEKLQTLNQKI